MTTYLIASNEMMCRILARRMEGQDIPTPVRWHGPEWLLDGDPVPLRMPSIDNPDATEPVPGQPVEMALVDCSGVPGDPRALLDRVRARLAPRRWLVLSDALDAPPRGLRVVEVQADREKHRPQHTTKKKAKL